MPRGGNAVYMGDSLYDALVRRVMFLLGMCYLEPDEGFGEGNSVRLSPQNRWRHRIQPSMQDIALLVTRQLNLSSIQSGIHCTSH